MKKITSSLLSTLAITTYMTAHCIDTYHSIAPLDQPATYTYVQLITPTRGDLAHDGSNPITISESGVYRLTDNMTGDGSSTLITISASNVELDLDDHTIDTCTNGIIITGTTVRIKNGTIQNGSTSGISISGDTCTLENVDILDTPIGYSLSSANYCSLTNCRALDCTNIGFSLATSSHNLCKACQASNIGSSTTVAGFSSANGSANNFESCNTTNFYTNVHSSAAEASGFKIDTETSSSVINCTVNGASSTSELPELYGITFVSTTSCIAKDNVVANVSGGAGAIGFAIPDNTTGNLMIDNVAYANDTNYAPPAGDSSNKSFAD